MIFGDDARQAAIGQTRQLTQTKPGPRAASATYPYIAHPVLALPFTVFVNQPLQPACDATSPDVFQVNYLASTLTRISTCPIQVKARIPVASAPLQVALTPDGSAAVVTSFSNAVNFIDLKSNQVVYTLLTDGNTNPSGVAISPDGKFAYITSFNTQNGNVQVIDLTSRSIVASIPVGAYPQSAFLTPDGSQLYVTLPLGNTVFIVDTLTRTVAGGVSVPSPFGIAFNSTGTRAFIASAGGNPNGTLQVVDTATLQVVASYPVGVSPVDVKITYGDRYVVVTNNGSDTVSVINTALGTVQTIKTASTRPQGLSIIR